MADRFGEDFRGSLYAVVRAGKLKREYLEALEDDNQTHLIKHKRLRDSIYGSNRAVLSWLSDFCRIDLLADDRSEINWRRKWWPLGVLAVVLVNATMMTEALYRHYLIDFAVLKYEQLSTKLAEVDRSNNSRFALQRKLEQASERLDQFKVEINSDWPFVPQYTILFYLPQALIAHIFLSFHFYRNKSVLLSLRAILDESKEASTWTKLVIEEIEHLIRNSLSFMASKYDEIDNDLTLSGQKRKSILVQRGSKVIDLTEFEVLTSSSQQLAAGHDLLKARLNRIALEGRLNRFQRSPKCRDLSQLVFFASFWGLLLNIVTGFTLGSIYLRSIFKRIGKTLPAINYFNNTTDLLSMFCLLVIAVSATSLYAAILNTSVLDQLLYVRRMKLIMKHLIEANTRRVFKMIALSENLKRPDNLRDLLNLENHNDALEMDLLAVILQFRLASRSFELQRKSVARIVLAATYFATTLSILVRIHSPYMPGEIKQINLAIGLFAIALATACITPLAILHQLWATTLGTLWSLVALLGHLESVPIIRERLTTGSSVSMLTLRREVSDPLQKHDRFACRILSMSITYPNLIRTVAWLILVLISLYDSQNSLFGNWFGDYMNDPFGMLDDFQ